MDSQNNAIQALEDAIDNLHIDAQFAIAALAPFEELTDVQCSIQNRIAALDADLERSLDFVHQASILDRMIGLSDCVDQIDVRDMVPEGYEAITARSEKELEEKRALFFLDTILDASVFHVAHAILQRAIRVCNERMDNPFIIVDIAQRHQEDSRSDAFVRQVVVELAEDLGFNPLHFPVRGEIKDRVRSVLIGVQNDVRMHV